MNTHTTWIAATLGACVGTFSHILLDSLFHSDIQPLQPWSAANHFRGMADSHVVELLCIGLGVMGLVWFFGREIKRRKASKASHAASEPAPGAASSAREG